MDVTIYKLLKQPFGESVSEWVIVKEFPKYSINSDGQIRHDESQRILHPRFNQYGVPYVGLMKEVNGEHRQIVRSLPRLVADAFIDRPSEVFDTPIQKDGDRKNCRVDNLVWRPRWYAVLYNQQFKDPYFNPIQAPVKAMSETVVHPTSLAAACAYGLLEREVVLSVWNRTYAWPTYHEFELASLEN